MVQHINAMNRFARMFGRGWKGRLHQSWLTGTYPLRVTATDQTLLQQARNTLGPVFLASFKPRESDFKSVGYLKKDVQERFNLKRAWFVNAWRIVNEHQVDLVQPWCNTKSEARSLAAELGICLLGEK